MRRTRLSTVPVIGLVALLSGCGVARLEPIGILDGVADTGAGGASDADAGTGGRDDNDGSSDSGGARGSGGASPEAGSGSTDAGGSPDCAPETWDDDGDGTTPCVSRTECSPGQVVTDPGSGATDRRCADCDPGTFSATSNTPSCAAWTDCAPGSFVTNEGTATHDRECAPCETGKTSTAVNSLACASLRVTQVVTGERQTCVLISDGSVKCWGGAFHGQLGYGNTDNVGDDELPSAVGAVSVTTTPGVTVKALAAGQMHTCALLSDGSVKCWGENLAGQLGYGNTANIGDDELPSSVGPVSITTTPGVIATAITAGWSHTCALLSDGSVKCWGGLGSQLGVGLGNTRNIGDDELPSSVGAISVTTTPGLTVAAIGGGTFHTCARLSDGTTKCWGRGGSGQLGYGTYDTIGDDELPSSVGAVSITTTPGLTATMVVGGVADTCARLSDGSARCWGTGSNTFPSFGIGYGNTESIGDDELPSSVGPLSLTTTPGVTVTAVSGGFAHKCALLSDGSVNCWGWDAHGQLGRGNTDIIGDDELPSSAGPASITTAPVTVTALSEGNDNFHTCAILSDGSARCWGLNSDGECGYGKPGNIGDDELPSSLGSVVLF